MEKKIQIVHPDDNVAVAVADLSAGEVLSIDDGDSVELRDDVAYGHKFALRDVDAGESIVKYGEEIGAASQAIQAGEHVHVHNVESRRGRGDLAELAEESQ